MPLTIDKKLGRNIRKYTLYTKQELDSIFGGNIILAGEATQRQAELDKNLQELNDTELPELNDRLGRLNEFLNDPESLPDGTTYIEDSLLVDEIWTGSVTALEGWFDKITANQLFVDKLVANEVFADTGAFNQIFTDTLTAEQISTLELWADEIIAENILADKITANEIDVTNLFSQQITIDAAGHIKSSNFNGVGDAGTDAGFIVRGDGTAEFQEIILKGDILAGSTLPDGIVETGTIAEGVITANKLVESSKRFGSDIEFTSSDWETVSWNAGTITFEDGTTSAILAGSYTHVDSAYRYIYYDGTDTLKLTTDLDVATSEGNIFLAMTKRAPDDVHGSAFVVDAVGKITLTQENLAVNSVRADQISVNSLSAVTADMGILTAGQITIEGTGGTGFLNGASGIAFAASSDNDINNAEFKVGYDGKLVATNASISGSIATGREISVGTTVSIGDSATVPEINYYLPKHTPDNEQIAIDTDGTSKQETQTNWYTRNKANITIVGFYDLAISNWSHISSLEIEIIGRVGTGTPRTISSNIYESDSGSPINGEYIIGNTFEFDEIAIRATATVRTYINSQNSTVDITNIKLNQQSSSIALTSDGLYQRISDTKIVPYGTGGSGSSLTVTGDTSVDWEGVENKPFSTIGNGLKVTSDVLNVNIGVDVQAWDADLDTYAGNPLTASELGQLQNINTVTISNAQWTALGSLSASASELNILDGATLSTTELNYVDGVTSAIQTQLDNKQPLDSELTTLAGMTSAQATGLVGTSGTATFNGLTINNTLIDSNANNYIDLVTAGNALLASRGAIILNYDSDNNDTNVYAEIRNGGSREFRFKDGILYANADSNYLDLTTAGNSVLASRGSVSMIFDSDGNAPSSHFFRIFNNATEVLRHTGSLLGVKTAATFEGDLTAEADLNVLGTADIATAQIDTLRTTLFKPNSVSGMGGEFIFQATSLVTAIDTGANTITVEEPVFGNGDAIVVSSQVGVSGFSKVRLNLTSAGTGTGPTTYSYNVDATSSGVEGDIEVGDTAVKVNDNLIYINANDVTNSPFIEGYNGVSGFDLLEGTATPNWYIRNNEISVGSVFSADGNANTGTLAGFDFDDEKLTTTNLTLQGGSSSYLQTGSGSNAFRLSAGYGLQALTGDANGRSALKWYDEDSFDDVTPTTPQSVIFTNALGFQSFQIRDASNNLNEVFRIEDERVVAQKDLRILSSEFKWSGYPSTDQTDGVTVYVDGNGFLKMSTTPPSAPSTPTNLAMAKKRSTDTMRISWDSVSGADSYTVQRSTDDSTWTTLSPAEITNNYITDSIPFNNKSTTYYYRVRANNSGGSSSYSSSVNDSWNTAANYESINPSNVFFSEGGSFSSVSWNTPLAGQPDSYNIQYRVNSGSLQNLITGLSGSLTSYDFDVCSFASNSNNVIIRVIAVYSAPSELGSTDSNEETVTSCI